MACSACCDIPSPAISRRFALLLLRWRLFFAAVFWAFVPSENDFGLSHICLWIEMHLNGWGFVLIVRFTKQSDAVMAKWISHLNSLRTSLGLRRKRMHSIKLNRPSLTSEPYRGVKEREKTNNIKQKPGTQARQQAAVENKTYYCEVCNVSCRDAATLRRHDETPRHKRKFERGDDDYECFDCDLSFRYLSDFNRHKLSKGHIAKTAENN